METPEDDTPVPKKRKRFLSVHETAPQAMREISPNSAPFSSDFHFRRPGVEDGSRIWRFVKASEALDLNSPYCYLVLCHHFADTCVIADDSEGLGGFIVGYRPPNAQDTVVVWQIGVAASRRGRGLGLAMLHELVRRDACRGAAYLEATVTPSNTASRATFTAFARSLNTQCVRLPGFGAELFPKECNHETEHLFRIGPFVSVPSAQVPARKIS